MDASYAEGKEDIRRPDAPQKPNIKTGEGDVDERCQSNNEIDDVVGVAEIRVPMTDQTPRVGLSRSLN